ncbi:MAG TPA: hypothetical protein VF188_02825 [Longimicrobiales bacterium]
MARARRRGAQGRHTEVEWQEMKTGNLKIRAIDNAFLADELEKTLTAQRGVRTAAVRPGRPGGAEVEYDETSTSLEQIVAELQRQGYDAEIGGYSAGGAP